MRWEGGGEGVVRRDGAEGAEGGGQVRVQGVGVRRCVGWWLVRWVCGRCGQGQGQEGGGLVVRLGPVRGGRTYLRLASRLPLIAGERSALEG